MAIKFQTTLLFISYSS